MAFIWLIILVGFEYLLKSYKFINRSHIVQALHQYEDEAKPDLGHDFCALFATVRVLPVKGVCGSSCT